MIKENILKNPSDAELTASVHENLYALFRSMQAIPGCKLVEDEYLSRHHLPFPNSFFRGVWRTRLSSVEMHTYVDQVIDWFQQHQASDFFWWTDVYTQPSGLVEHLINRGFDGNLEGDSGMIANLHALNEDLPFVNELTIRSATDPTVLTDWGLTFAQAFETDLALGQAWIEATLATKPHNCPWRLYVGYLDDRPVATSMLFNGAGVAGVYGVGTIPAERHRCIGSQMTWQPLWDARRQGYNFGVLFSSRMAYSVYARLGFHEVPSKIGIYYWEKESEQTA
jgi:hypothetical protein